MSETVMCYSKTYLSRKGDLKLYVGPFMNVKTKRFIINTIPEEII
ncbi:MAG: hypothetical protein WBI96_04600 [Candidatus Hydrothermia bacterium]